jgi:hypothetical protein
VKPTKQLSRQPPRIIFNEVGPSDSAQGLLCVGVQVCLVLGCAAQRVGWRVLAQRGLVHQTCRDVMEEKSVFAKLALVGGWGDLRF